jgi:hypothetical protein
MKVMNPLTRCDGVVRRDFLQLGMLSALGMSVADLLRWQALADSPKKESKKETSCILIWLDGGPTHIDTFDPKPDAPKEVRGPFGTISTAVPGVRISEHLPLTAKAMSDIALVRSLTHELGNHNTGRHYLMTGHRPTPVVAYPSLGSVLAKESGFGRALPPYVIVPQTVEYSQAGYLPGAYGPFAVGGDPSKPDFRVRDLNAPEGVSIDVEARRRNVLTALDDFSREVEEGPATLACDAFYEQAYKLLGSPAAKSAFDLKKEPGAVRNRYGRKSIGQGCLLARRLVDAGTRFVTVVDRGWDTHVDIARNLPDARFRGSGKVPALDRAFATLLTDLRERGLLDSTLVVLMGEFGRTPKINNCARRDHWPRAGFVCFSGGGVKGGQVIGATDAHGEVPSDTPVRPEDVAHSMLKLLGVDPHKEYIAPGGRPLKILDKGKMIPGLV